MMARDEPIQHLPFARGKRRQPFLDLGPARHPASGPPSGQ